MKQIAKKILPKSVINLASSILEPFFIRKSPRITAYQGKTGSVLQCCIAYNKYGGYCVPSSSRHRPAAQKILSGSIYEPRTIEFLMTHCGSGDIIHAGACFGDFLPALSHAMTPGSKVWAFEPNPENYLCAFITKYVNGLQNVELKNAGLGERSGFASMVISDHKGRSLGGMSRIAEHNDIGRKNGSQMVEVEIVTIDEIVSKDRTVSIIHLDVEGFEQFALTGALLTIERCKPIIVLETVPKENWLSKNLYPLRYQISEKFEYNTILVANY